MAITSGNDGKFPVFLKTTQVRYAVLYILVTFIVLLFLNIYTSRISQQLFYTNKKNAMIEICHITAGKISSLEVLNKPTLSGAVADISTLANTRIVITDMHSKALFDSVDQLSVEEKMVLFPEIITALDGNDVFTWRYHDGAMQSQVATPIISYGNLVGCIYITEYDTAQGALIASIQKNILIITVVLEFLVIFFSIFSSYHYARRLRRILHSMRIVRDGDYSHKTKLQGSDELGLLALEFNDLVSRLQISERKRSQFVSDASHELKTPLASIKLLSDSILQNDMELETIREFVGDIGNEAERLNRMSQKLLVLSRSDTEEDRDSEIIYISPTIQRVTRMLSAFAEKNDVKIIHNIQEDATILMPTDDLYQIIFNLAENGIKYNTRGGELYISLMRQDDNAVIRIRDSGVGIPEESVEHIFERFYRVDKARSRSTGGSGLGLSIVRNMVNRNGGTIQVESILGRGTLFTVTLPIFDVQEDSV